MNQETSGNQQPKKERTNPRRGKNRVLCESEPDLAWTRGSSKWGEEGGKGTSLAAQCEIPPLSRNALARYDSIAEGGIAPICLVFTGYRANIAEIPLWRGGYHTSTSHALQGGNAQKRGRGYRTQLAMSRTPKTPIVCKKQQEEVSLRWSRGIAQYGATKGTLTGSNATPGVSRYSCRATLV